MGSSIYNEFQEMVKQRHLKQMAFSEDEVESTRMIETKRGELYPMVKLKTVENCPSSKVFGGYKTRYVVTTHNGEPFCQVSLISGFDIAEMEYRNEGVRREGITLSAVNEVVKDVFYNKTLDNLSTPEGDSQVGTLQLLIDGSNRASQGLAKKAGFSYDEDSEIATLTYTQYMNNLYNFSEEQWVTIIICH